KARLGDAGSIGEAEITLGKTRLSGYDFHLPGPGTKVVVEGILFSNSHEGLRIDERRLGGRARPFRRKYGLRQRSNGAGGSRVNWRLRRAFPIIHTNSRAAIKGRPKFQDGLNLR